MEPFALFNFLQSLLQPPQNSKQTPSSDSTPENVVPPTETTQAGQDREENRDAFLQFIEAHERRSKRIKK